MAEKDSLAYLFENVHIYEHKVFDFFEENENGNYFVTNENINKILEYLGLIGTKNLITTCIFCEEHFPFKFNTRMTYQNGELCNGLLIGQRIIPGSGWFDVYFRIEDFRKLDCYEFPKKAVYKFSAMYLDYYFSCANKESHIYSMRLFIYLYDDKVHVEKIGQFPENVHLTDKKSSYFQNILRKFDAYIDYKNAEKSNDYGLSAGAYDYLRRVYEKMINYYLPKDFDDKARAKEKIDEVKDKFHPEIKGFLKPLYETLSLGVHQLTDAECKDHYENLKAVIDIQLEYIKEQEEMSKQIKESARTLNFLKEKYSKK